MKKTPQPPTARVTVRDLAAAAGFTIGTVSTVLNNRHVERRIPLETVEKIRGTAARLGYLPDIGARRLRSGTGLKHNIVIACSAASSARRRAGCCWNCWRVPVANAAAWNLPCRPCCASRPGTGEMIVAFEDRDPGAWVKAERHD